MASPISICNVFERIGSYFWGFDNDYVILKNTNTTTANDTDNTTDTDNTNEEKICECFVCYGCRFISRLSDTYIKHKSD